MLSNTRPFIEELERALPSRPFAVELWDGARLASTNGGGPTFSVRSPQALAHVLRAPGQLGLGRAYVSGELAVDDLDEVLELLDSWEPPPLDRRAQVRLGLPAPPASGPLPPPPLPETEPGQRVLDVGCGWGSFAMHAAANHDVQVVGITLSEPQAVLARRRAEERGLGERVDIRVMDYRELAGEPFDAVASIGMVEHVGSNQIDVYARQVARLVKPGGRVVNHGIPRLRTGHPQAGAFSGRYVFPDAAPLHLSRIQVALERAGLETEHVAGLRSDYAETLR